jgi:benzoylformate decarboxylase
VVCVIGEGSVQYAVSALYTAAAYEVPLTILVLRNTEYAILKWFAEFEQVEGAPGLDLPALNTAEIADGYGISSRRVEGSEELEAAMREAIASPRPELVEVGVAPGMWLA